MSTVSQIVEEYLRDINQLVVDSQQDNIINKLRLTDEILDQTRRYLHWTAVLSCAEAQMIAYSDLLKEVKADCRRQIRRELLASGDRATDKAVDDLLVLQPSYSSTLKTFRKYEELVSMLRFIETAFSDRSRMLQSANSRDRDELRIGGRQSTTHVDDDMSRQQSELGPRDWDGARDLFIQRKLEEKYVKQT